MEQSNYELPTTTPLNNTTTLTTNTINFSSPNTATTTPIQAPNVLSDLNNSSITTQNSQTAAAGVSAVSTQSKKVSAAVAAAAAVAVHVKAAEAVLVDSLQNSPLSLLPQLMVVPANSTISQSSPVQTNTSAACVSLSPIQVANDIPANSSTASDLAVAMLSLPNPDVLVVSTNSPRQPQQMLPPVLTQQVMQIAIADLAQNMDKSTVSQNSSPVVQVQNLMSNEQQQVALIQENARLEMGIANNNFIAAQISHVNNQQLPTPFSPSDINITNAQVQVQAQAQVDITQAEMAHAEIQVQAMQVAQAQAGIQVQQAMQVAQAQAGMQAQVQAVQAQVHAVQAQMHAVQTQVQADVEAQVQAAQAQVGMVQAQVQAQVEAAQANLQVNDVGLHGQSVSISVQPVVTNEQQAIIVDAVKKVKIAEEQQRQMVQFAVEVQVALEQSINPAQPDNLLAAAGVNQSQLTDLINQNSMVQTAGVASAPPEIMSQAFMTAALQNQHYGMMSDPHLIAQTTSVSVPGMDNGVNHPNMVQQILGSTVVQDAVGVAAANQMAMVNVKEAGRRGSISSPSTNQSSGINLTSVSGASTPATTNLGTLNNANIMVPPLINAGNQIVVNGNNILGSAAHHLELFPDNSQLGARVVQQQTENHVSVETATGVATLSVPSSDPFNQTEQQSQIQQNSDESMRSNVITSEISNPHIIKMEFSGSPEPINPSNLSGQQEHDQQQGPNNNRSPSIQTLIKTRSSHSPLQVESSKSAVSRLLINNSDDSIRQEILLKLAELEHGHLSIDELRAKLRQYQEERDGVTGGRRNNEGRPTKRRSTHSRLSTDSEAIPTDDQDSQISISPTDPMDDVKTESGSNRSEISRMAVSLTLSGPNMSTSSMTRPDDEQDSERQDSHRCMWRSCSKVFVSLDQLIGHVTETHIGSGKATYSCDWEGCNRGQKPFTKRHKMYNHLRTHTGERPYMCDTAGCGKRFSRPDSLTTHIKTHSNVRPYICSSKGCGKAYYHSRSLRKHEKTHETRTHPHPLPPVHQTGHSINTNGMHINFAPQTTRMYSPPQPGGQQTTSHMYQQRTSIQYDSSPTNDPRDLRTSGPPPPTPPSIHHPQLPSVHHIHPGPSPGSVSQSANNNINNKNNGSSNNSSSSSNSPFNSYISTQNQRLLPQQVSPTSRGAYPFHNQTSVHHRPELVHHRGSNYDDRSQPPPPQQPTPSPSSPSPFFSSPPQPNRYPGST